MPDSNSFGIQCLDSSAFYASNNGSAFLGCCTVDPSTTDDGLCPDDKIRPATFDSGAYSEIPSQECIGHDAGVFWYTCSGTSPPFLGCCAVNPCAKDGCPPSALKPAKLSSNEKNASSFMEGLAPTTSTSATASPTTLATSTTSSTPGATTPSASAPTASGGTRHQGVQPATVAGITIGIAAGALVIAIFVFWWLRKRRTAAKEKAFAVAGMTPVSPDTPSPASSTPSWFYNASPTHQTNSPSVPERRSNFPHAVNAMPPDYHTVAKKTIDPAELPGSVCFELAGDSPRSPHSR